MASCPVLDHSLLAIGVVDVVIAKHCFCTHAAACDSAYDLLVPCFGLHSLIRHSAKQYNNLRLGIQSHKLMSSVTCLQQLLQSEWLALYLDKGADSIAWQQHRWIGQRFVLMGHVLLQVLMLSE